MRGFVLVSALVLSASINLAQAVTMAAPDDTAATGMNYGAFLAMAFPGAQLRDGVLTVPNPVTLHTLQGDQVTVKDPRQSG